MIFDSLQYNDERAATFRTLSAGHYCPVISPTASAVYDRLYHGSRIVVVVSSWFRGTFSKTLTHLKLVKCCVNFALVASVLSPKGSLLRSKWAAGKAVRARLAVGGSISESIGDSVNDSRKLLPNWKKQLGRTIQFWSRLWQTNC